MTVSQHHYAVILAGGRGTRFWPLSRTAQPKQFLRMSGTQSLFEQTIERVRPLIPPSRILVITGADLHEQALRQSRRFRIPAGNVLFEPAGRNTAPAICWAAARLFARDPQAVMAVLPADHLIARPAAFLRHFKKALRLAEQQYLVTIGIVPTRPETGYGYMRSHAVGQGRAAIWPVEAFTEKPSRAKAEAFIKERCYFWNSGMFFWRADNILTEFAMHLPAVYDRLFAKTDAQVRRAWTALPHISVDYGILEKAENVVTIPAADMGWSDLGSWEALYETGTPDRSGNVLAGPIVALDCQGSYVRGQKRLIAAIGLRDVVIVDTPDALLVCRRDLAQQVRGVVDQIQRQKKNQYL